jgi:hypothetical protein
MQLLANIAAGALLAGVSLGPAAWTEVSHAEHRILQTASQLIGFESAGSPLTHAVATARRALPHLPRDAH